MSIAALISDLVKSGTDPELVGRVAEALASREPVVIKDEQAERRRANDRERKRLYGPDWGDVRQAVWERDGFVCAYCGTEDALFCVDHIIPVSKGGTNAMDNLVVACIACNSSKKDRDLADWKGRAV